MTKQYLNDTYKWANTCSSYISLI